MKNQFRITTNKGEAYLAYAGGEGGKPLLAGDAIELAMSNFYCPLRAIAKVELETSESTTVIYNEKGEGYSYDDLLKLYQYERRKY